MTLAILCSGQGAQHAGMFQLTGDAPAAASLFERAGTLLGHDPRRLVSEAAREQLFENRTAQLLCSLQALAADALLADILPKRRCIAGYSVGEVAAWGVAGLIEPAATLELVATRAEAMNAANRGQQGMLFVRGLTRDVVEQLCEGQDAAIAIANPGEAWVIGGLQPALDAIAVQAKASGALRVVPVHVTVASHTYLLADASVAFRDALAGVSITHAPKSGVRLLSGLDAASVLNVDEGVRKLARQISEPIDWAACLAACIEAGASAFLELGPGRALAEMAAGAYPAIPSRSVDDFHSLAGLASWLSRVASDG
jgi:[acyl-carrier-protein] S-malonyltransferase